MKVGNGSEGGDGYQSLIAVSIIQLEVDETSEGGHCSQALLGNPFSDHNVDVMEHCDA